MLSVRLGALVTGRLRSTFSGPPGRVENQTTCSRGVVSPTAHVHTKAREVQGQAVQTEEGMVAR